jgi:hypothetical protein
MMVREEKVRLSDSYGHWLENVTLEVVVDDFSTARTLSKLKLLCSEKENTELWKWQLTTF